jgi:hypothetical protein
MDIVDIYNISAYGYISMHNLSETNQLQEAGVQFFKDLSAKSSFIMIYCNLELPFIVSIETVMLGHYNLFSEAFLLHSVKLEVSYQLKCKGRKEDVLKIIVSDMWMRSGHFFCSSWQFISRNYY